MEVYNIEAMLTGHAAVFTKPDSGPQSLENGVVSVEIDPRESGTVEKVMIGDEEVSFTFEDGRLSFPPSTTGSARALITFTDGSVLPLDIAAI